jgi:hypothetical protein
MPGRITRFEINVLKTGTMLFGSIRVKTNAFPQNHRLMQHKNGCPNFILRFPFLSMLILQTKCLPDFSIESVFFVGARTIEIF